MSQEPAVRRVLALVVMVIAGLASLATSYPSHQTLSYKTDGVTRLASEAVAVSAAVTVEGALVQPPREGTLTLIAAVGPKLGSPAESPPPVDAVPVEARLVTASSPSPAWSALPVTVALPLEDCVWACRHDVAIELRQAAPASGELVVRWQLIARISELPTFPQRDPVSFRLEPSPVDTPLATASEGAMLGFVVAVALSSATLLRRRTRKHTVALEALVAAGLASIGALFLYEGWTLGVPDPAAGALMLALAVVAISGPALRQLRIGVQPWLAPTLVLATQGLLASSLLGAIYRPHDVFLAGAAIGAAIGALALILPGLGSWLRGIARRDWRDRLVVALALATGLCMLGLQFWQPIAGPSAVILVACVWLWLRGVTVVTPLVAGLALPLTLVATMVGSSFSHVFYNLGTPQPVNFAAREQVAAIMLVLVAIGCVAIAVGTILPPSTTTTAQDRRRAVPS